MNNIDTDPSDPPDAADRDNDPGPDETGEAPTRDGAASAESGAESGAEAPESADNAEALHEQIESLKQQRLLALAETENVRKRAARERDDTRKYAVAEFARDVVGISDNLARALETVPNAVQDGADDHLKSLIEGIEMTQRMLETALQKQGIERIDAIGAPFDHNLHEAMFEVEDGTQPPGTVVQVIQCGYRIHDRLLRPAMVGVAKRPPPGEGVDTEV